MNLRLDVDVSGHHHDRVKNPVYPDIEFYVRAEI